MMNEEERVAHLSGRWATSSPPCKVIHHPCRHPPLPSSTTPPVIPANAGIYVPSPVSYARECGVKAHHMPGCVRTGVNGLQLPRELPVGRSQPAVPESWGYVDSGFRRKDDISVKVTAALPPNSGMTLVSSTQLRVQTSSRAYRRPANCGTHVGAQHRSRQVECHLGSCGHFSPGPRRRIWQSDDSNAFARCTRGPVGQVRRPLCCGIPDHAHPGRPSDGALDDVLHGVGAVAAGSDHSGRDAG